MIELPECMTLARQMNASLIGWRIAQAAAGASPHRFAFYTGDPKGYGAALEGRVIQEARSFGGILEVSLGDIMLMFNDGANLRLHAPNSKLPEKHQLLLVFENGSALSCTVQMYAGISLCPEGAIASDYHRVARGKPSPLGDAFSPAWFQGLPQNNEKLSAKAFLATQQRIPGLGNGALQDILFRAHVHPRTKMASLNPDTLGLLYRAVKDTLKEMADKGGRDTEKDLYGLPGGYATQMGKANLTKPCSGCGGTRTRENYLGGNVYYCPVCQPLLRG